MKDPWFGWLILGLLAAGLAGAVALAIGATRALTLVYSP